MFISHVDRQNPLYKFAFFIIYACVKNSLAFSRLGAVYMYVFTFGLYHCENIIINNVETLYEHTHKHTYGL